MRYRVTDWDDAYANGAHIAGAEAYPPRWAAMADGYRSIHPPLDRGGDLFLPASRDAPRGLMVFVHGGYWMRFSPRDFSHLAAGALARGWACLMPRYDLAPGARIARMTRQVAEAITNCGIEGPVAIAGHSAGGHLAARMVCKGVLPDRIAARVTACLPISPLADLRPLMRTAMNETLRLDASEAMAESPALLEPLTLPVTVWAGGAERPEFIRQARLLADIWAGLGAATECVIEPGRHHFDIIEGLSDPDSPMMDRLLDQRLSR